MSWDTVVVNTTYRYTRGNFTFPLYKFQSCCICGERALVGMLTEDYGVCKTCFPLLDLEDSVGYPRLDPNNWGNKGYAYGNALYNQRLDEMGY